jgi:hypothetical protein
VLFTSQVGYYFIYTIQQIRLKEEAKEQMLVAIPDSLLEIIVLEDHFDAIAWQEIGKEFSLNKELYDIARIRKVNGKTLLYCLKDDKEKALLEDMAKAIHSSHQGNNGKAAKQTIKFQLPDFLNCSTGKLVENTAVILHSYSTSENTFFSTIAKIKGPPPRA